MPADEPSTDVTATLTDLERRLVALEQELSAMAGPAPARAPESASAGDTAAAGERVEDLRGEIAELGRYRDQLEAAAHELVAEYQRLVERLEGQDAAAPPGS